MNIVFQLQNNHFNSFLAVFVMKPALLIAALLSKLEERSNSELAWIIIAVFRFQKHAFYTWQYSIQTWQKLNSIGFYAQVTRAVMYLNIRL